MSDPVAELRYRGEIRVQPYRRGTFLGREHLQELIEQTLGSRYSFGEGWQGYAVVAIELYDEEPDAGSARPS